MSLAVKTISFCVISLVALVALTVVAAVMGHPYTAFESITTFQLSMAMCWLSSIMANTSKSN